MMMPGRNSDSESFRYGFHGMEKDKEVKGEGNLYTTLFRLNDTRLGNWLSIDPKFNITPDESPYSSMGNNPILNIDPNGDCIPCLIAGLVVASLLDSDFAESPGSDNSSEAQDEAVKNRETLSNVNDIVKIPFNPRSIPRAIINKTNSSGVKSNSTNNQSKQNGPSTPKPNQTKKDVYVPKNESGQNRKLEHDQKGKPIIDIDAKGKPHTQMGMDKTDSYPKRRTIDEKGRKTKDIDHTDHGKPQYHPNPHQHKYDPNTGRKTTTEPPTDD